MSSYPPNHLRTIVVEGPIGVGKTSLARRLADHYGSDLFLEAAEDNPFLARFYENPREAALQTQLFFLFQRTQQVQDLRQGDLFRSTLVADFLLEKDRLFAELTLQENELQLYDQVYEMLSVEPMVPDLVVYLQAPVDVLMQRVSRRARTWEKSMMANYLERLSESYARFFHNYELAPMLIVNTSNIDPISRDEDFELLLEQIETVKHGRQYFNPAPLEF